MKTCSGRALVPPDLAHDFTLVTQLSRGRGIICQSTSEDAYTRHRNVHQTHLSMYVDEKDRLYLGDLVDQLLFVVLHLHNHHVYHLLEHLDVDALHVQGSVIISTEGEG